MRSNRAPNALLQIQFPSPREWPVANAMCLAPDGLPMPILEARSASRVGVRVGPRVPVFGSAGSLDIKPPGRASRVVPTRSDGLGSRGSRAFALAAVARRPTAARAGAGDKRGFTRAVKESA